MNGMRGPARALGITLAAAVAWVFMEWLFFVTQPSFLSLFGLGEQWLALSGAALVVGLSALAVALPFIAAGWLLRRLGVPERPASALALLPACLLLVVALLVAADNFTQTLFGRGIRDAGGTAVWVYRSLVLLAVATVASWLQHRWQGRSRVPLVLATVAMLVMAGALPWLLAGGPTATAPVAGRAGEGVRLPNILVMSGDGIAARHMSLYGHARETTPFLDSIKSRMLVAERHFPNAGDTGGSVVSMLTGRLPTTTRVVYPPDVLRGEAAWQHLPGMLKSMGYYTANISVRHYADPYDLNIRDGFDVSNMQEVQAGDSLLARRLGRHAAIVVPSLLVDRMLERAGERLRHVWLGEPMSDPMAEVVASGKQKLFDSARVRELDRLLESAPRPFFIHVHMMVTHGAVFRPRQRTWSDPENAHTPWDLDGYDDAIADFDHKVRHAWNGLERLGLLEDTVLVVTSDHSIMNRMPDPVPFAMRLPGDAHAGVVAGTSQRVDIAPTLLDLLGAEIPAWMEGRSLLPAAGPLPVERLVFGVGVRKKERSQDGRWWSAAGVKAPWYSLGNLYLVHCGQGFSLAVDSMTLGEEAVETFGQECPRHMTGAEALGHMQQHLADRGYPVD